MATNLPPFEKNPMLELSDLILATVQDELGFKPYVKALASFLADSGTRGPLTVSVEGEWGSGKTSFMRQLQQEMELIGGDGAERRW